PARCRGAAGGNFDARGREAVAGRHVGHRVARPPVAVVAASEADSFGDGQVLEVPPGAGADGVRPDERGVLDPGPEGRERRLLGARVCRMAERWRRHEGATTDERAVDADRPCTAAVQGGTAGAALAGAPERGAR